MEPGVLDVRCLGIPICKETSLISFILICLST